MKCSKCGRKALCGAALFRVNEKGPGIDPVWECHECRNPEVIDPVLDEVVGIIEGASKTKQ